MNIKEFKPVTEYKSDPVFDRRVSRGVIADDHNKQNDLEIRRLKQELQEKAELKVKAKKLGAVVLAGLAVLGAAKTLDIGLEHEQNKSSEHAKDFKKNNPNSDLFTVNDQTYRVTNQK